MSETLMFAARYRAPALLILVVITAILASGLPKLRIDTRLELLLDRQGDKYLRYLEALETFGSDNKTVFYVQHERLFSPEKLEVLQSLADDLDALEAVERVDSLFSLTSIRNRDGSLESKVVLEWVPFDQGEADAALEDALYSPLLRGNVVGERGDVTALTVTIRPPRDGERDLDRRTHEEFEQIVERYSEEFDELFHAGNLRVGNDLRSYLIRDIATLVPASLLALFLTVGLLLRSFTMSLLPVLTSVLSTVWTFGLMGHIGIPVNLLTAMLPTLLLVIGATEDIHLSSAFIEAYDNDEAIDRFSAVEYMAKHMAVAVIITTFTTSIGFVSNVFSNLEIIKQFAVVASFGIVANAVTTFLSVPPLLSLLGPQPSGPLEERQQGRLSLLQPLARFCIEYLHASTNRYPMRVALVSALLLAGSLLTLQKVSVNTDPMTFFADDAEIITHTNTITDNLSGVLTFFVVVGGGENGAFQRPEHLQKLASLVEYINGGGVFDRAMAHTEHLSLVNREMHDGDPAYYRPPDDSDLVEQFLVFFQRSDLEPYIDPEASTANVVVRYSIYGSGDALRELAKLEAAARQIVGPDMTIDILGKYALVNEASGQLVTNEIKAITVIVSVIFCIMWLFYGSWRAGLVSLVPNLFPILFTFTVMVLAGIEVNPATAMIASIVIGVAIDDTTHLLTRFNAESRKSDDMDEVIRTVVNVEAIPVIVSSLALGVGFAVLTVSEFTLTAEFGFLAAIAMVFALLTEFIVTPLLMRNLWTVNIGDLLAADLPVRQLKRSPVFAGMSRFQIRRLVLLSRERFCRAGEIIDSGDDHGEEMYVVLDGKVCLSMDEGSASQVESELGVGDVVGDVAYVDGEIRTTGIRVVEDSHLLVLNHKTITDRLRLYPFIAAKLNDNMARLHGHRLA